MGMLQSLVLLLLCMGVALHADAQNATVRLQGSIQDAFLERGLVDCVVTLMRADSTLVECKPEVLQIGNDSQHFTTIYFINVPRQSGEYLIRMHK